ncbi:MAG: hypothetical protein WDM86_00345 [Rhizomicrobium sp.]
MWRDPDAPATTTEARSASISPALQTFALNPLRVLRIAAGTTTTQAAFEAEQAVILSRADMALDTPDLLPWLPQPDPVEMQRAAQTIEEPLLRLKNEFLWFDPAGDPHGALLARILAERSDSLLCDYLAAIPPPPKDDSADIPAPVNIATRINAANLNLLAAACRLNGCWPADTTPATTPLSAGSGRTPETAAVRLDVHRTIADDRSPDVEAIRAHWQAGLEAWGDLQSSPALVSHIAVRIAAIDDDFVQQNDAETLVASIRAHLVDVSAQEIRALLLRNQYGLARAMIAAVAAGGLDLRELTPAMRPVRQVMQNELTSLDHLLNDAGTDKIEPLQRYLRRLAVIRRRWQATDRTNVLGLVDLLDNAAERAFLQLRRWDKPDAQTDAMLQQISANSFAQSLRERIASLRTQQNQQREHVCYFCQENEPDYDRSVVLHGKRFERQTHKFGQTTNHYTITDRLVLRCARCAKLHQYVRQIALAFMLVLGLAIVAGLYAWASMPPTEPRATGMTLEGAVHSVTAGIANFPTGRPTAGTGELDETELRYCLVAQIVNHAMSQRMDDMRLSDVNTYNLNVDFYNGFLAQYDAECLQRQYLIETKEQISPGVELNRTVIEENARALIQ